ncbi:MAG: hypothetical protein E7450_01550 [Ruminococcaceae bacterium]|nr:hypothetical protein [Oscillospiraceae bacterium]
MFRNIGKKIKVLALIIFIIETAAAVITGISMMAVDEFLIPSGFLVLVAGPVVAWISSWFMYGFGEIIDKLTAIEKNTRGEQSAPIQPQAPVQQPIQQQVPSERIQRIENLHAQGLISEDEYQQAISNCK